MARKRAFLNDFASKIEFLQQAEVIREDEDRRLPQRGRSQDGYVYVNVYVYVFMYVWVLRLFDVLFLCKSTIHCLNAMYIA